jgi:hypothetical protein
MQQTLRFVSCGVFIMLSLMACVRRPQVATIVPTDFATNTATTTPMIKLQETLTPTVTVAPVATELPTALPNPTPTSFVPESAASPELPQHSDFLVQIQPMPALGLRWITENQFGLAFYYRRDAGCWETEWQTYSVLEQEDTLAFTPSYTETTMLCEQSPPHEQQWSPQVTGQLTEWLPAPDGFRALAVLETLDRTAPLILNDPDAENQYLEGFQEAWLIDLSEGLARPLVASRYRYFFQWTGDGRYLLAEGSCYGDGFGMGVHAIDTEAWSVQTLVTDHSAHCEGSVGYVTSPSGHALLHKGTLFAFDGKPSIPICDQNEKGLSHTWSDDSQRAYVACSREEQPVTLRRYDEITGKQLTLMDSSQVPLNIREMVISPDERYLVFTWGRNSFNLEDERGVWLLKLSELVAGS